MLRLLTYYKYLFALSGVILVAGIVSLAIFGLRLGIDFKGGAITEIQFKQAYDLDKVRQTLVDDQIKNFQLQTTNDNGLIIKTDTYKYPQESPSDSNGSKH